jgi:transcriptional regulator with XRE-family HTH domain
MEDRARRAGYPISRSAISDYAQGRIATRPTRERVEALAAALECTFTEAATAVNETYRLDEAAAPDVDARRAQRAQAWLRLTGERTDAEVAELLLIVEQILQMRDLDGP